MYILIECVDREINVIGKFETENLAYNAMELRLANTMGLDTVPHEWKDNVANFCRYDDYDIQIDSAWINDVVRQTRGIEFDWKIVEV